MRVLFSGGGSGGHINPAIAMADMIRENIPNAEIAFVGTPRGMENSLVPKAGYKKLYHVEIRGIQRSFTLSNIKSLCLAFSSPYKARKIIREFAPDVVIGTGGYACWPALKAAADLGVPTILHESNVLPGLAVKRLQKDVDIILTNFEATGKLLSKGANVVNVGNPLRSSCTVSKEEARARLNIPKEKSFVVLSFGGSLGSREINHAAAEMMGNVASRHDDMMCYHVGGKKHYDSAKSYFAAYGLERNPSCVLMEYTSELPLYMAAADVVICRAGAMTLTEIAKMGKAAIIIPSPNVADNHQYKNAKELADKNAATVICEDELKVDGECRVCIEVERLYSDAKLRRDMEENIKSFAKENVEKKIFDIIVKLAESKKKIISSK